MYNSVYIFATNNQEQEDGTWKTKKNIRRVSWLLELEQDFSVNSYRSIPST